MADLSVPDNVVTLADWVAERDREHQANNTTPASETVQTETFALNHDHLHTIVSAMKIATSAVVAVVAEDPDDTDTILEMVGNLNRLSDAAEVVEQILAAIHAGKNVQTVVIPF
jgi:hypothetical protein